MKSIKYTLAALAVIALASFSTAKAQNVAGVPGDVVLGVFNTTNSLEFDLGTFGSLQAGETWDLGNVSSTAGSNLSFSLAASAQSGTTAAGGLLKGQIALGGVNMPTTIGTLTSEINSISSAEEAINQPVVTPADGHSYIEALLSATGNGAYALEDGGTGFGLGGANNIDQSWTGNDTAALYTLVKSGTATEVGVFSTSTVGGDTILTFEAAPEPSAYALGLCAVALFFVLKRRRTVA